MFNWKTLTVLCSLFLLACNDDKPKENKVLGNEMAASTEKAAAETSISTPAVVELPSESNEKALFKAKARRVIGNVELSKAEDSWKKMHQGNMVVEGNKVRTHVESDVQLTTNDGTSFVIMENAEVKITASLVKESKQQISFDIGKGSIQFDVQKQKNRSFEFRTGTATAAIRGTAGFVGKVKGQMVASLKEGKVDVTSAKGKTSSIVQNQTVLVNETGSVKKMNLASSGTKALVAAIDSVASTTEDVDIEKSIKKFDADYAARRKAFEKNLKFQGADVEKKIYVPTITLQAFATPGIVVEILGEVDTVGANGLYQRTFSWDADAFGTKRFLASCGDGVVDVPCFMWVVDYVENKTEESAENAPAKVEKSKAEAAKAETPKGETAKSINMTVKIGGPRTETIHLDPPASQYKGNLKFSLAGISAEDLDQIKNITIRRGGSVVETIGENDLTSLSYESEIQIGLNTIANFEVVVAMKNGKNFRGKKTYEVYCLRGNHPGGKARNSLMPQDKEYEKVKADGLLKDE